MDSPSSIEVPRPVGKEFYTPCYIARKQALHLEDNRGKSLASDFYLEDNRGKSLASGTRKKTSERGRITRECHA